MHYTVKWLAKGFQHPVSQIVPDETTARLFAIEILAKHTTERINFFPSNEAEDEEGN